MSNAGFDTMGSVTEQTGFAEGGITPIRREAARNSISKVLSEPMPPVSGMLPVQEFPFSLAIDTGSTQTRTIAFATSELESVNSDATDMLVMDSEYAVVPNGVSVASNGASAMRNLEMIISSANSANPCNGLHIVRGPLINTVNGRTRLLASSGTKAQQDALYINMVSSLATMLLLYLAGSRKVLTNTVKLDLIASLPASDMESQVNVRRFINNICDTYTVNFPKFGICISFMIDQSTLRLTSESEAAALYTNVTEANLDDDDESSVIYVNCGGSTTGISLVKNGIMVGNSNTLFVGGNSILNEIARLSADYLNGVIPSINAVRSALNTGMIKCGGALVDISEAINAAKPKLAEAVYAGILSTMDDNLVRAIDIKEIVCTGRSFGKSEYQNRITSPSIAEYISKKFAELSAGTKIRPIFGDEPVMKGLMYSRVADLGTSYLEK